MSNATTRAPPLAEETEEAPSEVFDRLEERVDLVISDHGVVEAELERRVHSTLRKAGFSERVGRFEPTRVAPRLWDPKEFHVDEAVLADRQERARLLRELDPGVVRPRLDDPLVTRAGVFYVPPEFFQAVGIERRMDADLLRHGIRSVNAFLTTSDTELAKITGLSVQDVSRAKEDLDLTRQRGVDAAAADLLRLAGVHSRSRLATSDPALLFHSIERLCTKHRFLAVPTILVDEAAVRSLVHAAQGLQ